MDDFKDVTDAPLNEAEFTDVTDQPAEENITADRAGVYGTMEGLTLGHMAEISAVPQTAKDVVSAMGEAYAKDGIMGSINVLPNILETHRNNTSIEQETHDKLEKKYPIEYMASEAFGSLATESAIIAAPALLGAAPITLSGMLSAHFGVNFAYGFGKAENETLGENINEAIEMGGIGMALPPFVQKGAQALPKVAMGLAKTGAKKAVDKGLIDNKKYIKQGMLKFLGLGEESTGVAAEKYGKNVDDLFYRITDYSDVKGEQLINPKMSRLETLKKFTREREVEGKSMGNLLSQLDNLGSGNKSHRQMFERIDEEIFQGPKGLLNAGDVKNVETATRVRSNLEGLFFNKNPDTGMYDTDLPREGFNAYMLHDYMSTAYNQAKKNTKKGIDPVEGVYYKTKKRIADMLWEDLDDIIEGTPIKEDYVRSKLRWGDIKTVEDQLRKHIVLDEKGTDVVNSLVRNRLAYSGSVMSFITGAGMNNKALMAASAAAIGLQSLYENPKVNGYLATTARNVAEEFKKNPDKYNKLAGTMISSLSRPGTAFIDQLGVAGANIELSNRPVERTTQDVLAKQDHILTLVNEFDPEVAKNLREAINLGDEQTIAGIMVSLAPKAPKGTVQPGIGWDGRAVTPEGREAVLTKLRTLTPRQRQTLIPKFEKDGVIPQEFYNEVNPKPVNVMQYIKKQRQNGSKKADY